MIVEARDGCRLSTRIEGPDHAPALVLAHGLGMDMTLWDEVLPLLPGDIRVLRYDLRGHGGSDVPDAPYTMGQMVSDAEAVIEAHGLTDTVFAGLSLGGMVAQGWRSSGSISCGASCCRTPRPRSARRRSGRSGSPRSAAAVSPRSPRRCSTVGSGATHATGPWPQGHGGCWGRCRSRVTSADAPPCRAPISGRRPLAAPAGAGARGVRGPFGACRSRARNGRSDPRRAVRDHPPRRTSATRGASR